MKRQRIWLAGIVLGALMLSAATTASNVHQEMERQAGNPDAGFERLVPDGPRNLVISEHAGPSRMIGCDSADGVHCRTTPDGGPSKPLYCGAEHKKVHGITGYDYRNHWCAKAFAKHLAVWERHPGIGVPISINPDGDVQCYSTDGRHCTVPSTTIPIEMTEAYRNAVSENVSPLACGPMHKGVWARTGYEDGVHWCGKAYGKIGNFVAILNDTQITWTLCNDGTKEECATEILVFGQGKARETARYYNQNVVDAINALRHNLGRGRERVLGTNDSPWLPGPTRAKPHHRKILATIINGDLTAYGSQHDYLKDFEEIWVRGPVGDILYPGLGNHDYENNVGNCFRNRCAIHMMNSFRKMVEAIPGKRAFDYTFGDDGTDFKWFGGSYGYSWNFGKFHFLQLNNYPGYTKSWTVDGTHARTNITSSVAWADQDLQRAEANGEVSIVNFHRADVDNSLATNVFNARKVKALFNGHAHGNWGRANHFGKLPNFFGGAPTHGRFMLVQMKDEALYMFLMRVHHFSTMDGRNIITVTDRHGRDRIVTFDQASLDEIFDTSPNGKYYADSMQLGSGWPWQAPTFD